MEESWIMSPLCSAENPPLAAESQPFPSSQSPNLSTSQCSSIPSGKISTTLQVKSTSSHDQMNTKPDESQQSPKTHYLKGDYQKQFHNSVTLGVDLGLELEKCEVQLSACTSCEAFFCMLLLKMRVLVLCKGSVGIDFDH
jgi:hypothetical protein